MKLYLNTQNIFNWKLMYGAYFKSVSQTCIKTDVVTVLVVIKNESINKV